MRDPELVAHAQRAATRLESAWEQWRALHGLAVAPGQPRGELLVHLERDRLERHPLDRGLLRHDLPRQDRLSALCAFIAVEEAGQVLGLAGVDPMTTRGSPQGSLSE